MGSAQQTVVPPDGSIVSSQFSSADLTLPDTTTVGSTLKVDTIQGKTTAGTVAMPSGSVIQVLQGEVLTQITNSSSSYGSVVSQAITPKFSSSKILIQCSGCANAEGNNALYFKLLRDSTEIGSGTGGGYYNVIGAITNSNGGTEHFDVKGFSIQFFDSPSTTSATTYQLQAAATNGTAKIGGRRNVTDIAVPTRITLMEIAQ
tara:strand:+ start:22 stop:630 length:609 start_codon:yes stop_codon:yes gene_type:complete